MNRQPDAHGYILVETLVSMALLSICMLPIYNSVRDAIEMRGHAEDYTTARFLLEELMTEQELQPELMEENKSGNFPAPHERFSYTWRIERVYVPFPDIPQHVTDEQRQQILEQFQAHMARLEVTVEWARGGQPFSATGETLLPGARLWLPPDKRAPQ